MDELAGGVSIDVDGRTEGSSKYDFISVYWLG